MKILMHIFFELQLQPKFGHIVSNLKSKENIMICKYRNLVLVQKYFMVGITETFKIHSCPLHHLTSHNPVISSSVYIVVLSLTVALV
jgi:hypothetical protein